jgi:hypothetical protein
LPRSCVVARLVRCYIKLGGLVIAKAALFAGVEAAGPQVLGSVKRIPSGSPRGLEHDLDFGVAHFRFDGSRQVAVLERR